MNSIKLLEGLQEKKAEIEAQLASVQPLIDDLAAIERLIKREMTSTNGHAKKAAPSGRHSFQPDPDSRSSHILTEARRVLEAASGRELPFGELCQRLPKELVRTSKERQYARIVIQRAGKRAGIQYVNANRVRLTE